MYLIEKMSTLLQATQFSITTTTITTHDLRSFGAFTDSSSFSCELGDNEKQSL